MSSLTTDSPKLVKGVVLDATSWAIKRAFTLQYDPDMLSRSDQVQSAGGRRIPSQFLGPSSTALPKGIIPQPLASDTGDHISKSTRASDVSLQRAGLSRASVGGHRA